MIKELFPYLRVRNAPSAIAWYVDVFGAREKFRLAEPAGRVGHAELELGSAVLMLSEEYPELGLVGPETIGRASSSIHLHVADADALIAKAKAAGATVTREPTDQFYGERSGAIRDPFGHEWLIGHELEALSPAEMQRRYDELMGKSR